MDNDDNEDENRLGLEQDKDDTTDVVDNGREAGQESQVPPSSEKAAPVKDDGVADVDREELVRSRPGENADVDKSFDSNAPAMQDSRAPTSEKQSYMSFATESDHPEDQRAFENLKFEWEEELEEYDEPDVYPSEKDYKWVEELVSASESEEELPEPTPIADEDKAAATGEGKTGEAATEEGEAAEGKKEEGEAPPGETKAGEPIVSGVKEGEEAADEADEGELLTQEVEQEPETPKKKYKTVTVKKLVPRPPKIHYEPAEERTTHLTNDKYFYKTAPFWLFHSYGYDCQRMANLHVLDEKTLVFMSGFILTFLNHQTLEKSFLRCIGGSCFGALAIHPSRKLFAAAEKGHSPLIGIWSWPKLQLFRKLQEGTQKVYASVNFSPDGSLLASQGGEPDYLITVWNWLAEMPILRVKSHAQDVFRVTFSKELAGRLTTSGLCHIKFWKMADTFTGLKLKGDIGRFGKTELSDIEGYVEMPDGKVLSGCEWGNLLVWENGLIVAECCIRTDTPCHAGIVRQVLLIEGEFYTTGQDGWVKTWNFDAIDTAEINTSEESLQVPIKSMTGVFIGDGVDAWSIVPDVPDFSSSSVYWFAQDGAGAIWKVDLSFLNTAKEPIIITTSHGGPIVGCRTSSNNCLFATLGADGQIRVYNYITKELVAKRTFAAPGSVLLWPSSEFDANCTTMIAGFADGTIRVVALSGAPDREGSPLSIVLVEVRKPHGRKVTTMALDSDGQYLVTGGEDGTIFFFDAKQDLLPLFFISMPDYLGVRIVQWVKQSPDAQAKKVLVALEGAVVQEVVIPQLHDINNETSYLYMDAKLSRRCDCMSIKSELRHNEALERERLAAEAREKALEEENRKRIEDDLETQSEQDLRLLQEAEELERLKLEEKPKPKWQPFIPAKPSPILLMMQSPFEDNTVVLSMGEYDAGYLYIIKLVESKESEHGAPYPQEPEGSIPVDDSDDVPITSLVHTTDGEQIIMGFEDGRISFVQAVFAYDLENLGPHWTEGIHDCMRGSVTSIALDKDNVFMITCGNDSNCFIHSLVSKSELQNHLEKTSMFEIPKTVEKPNVADIFDPDHYTLERFKNIEKEMALLAAAKRNKTAKREEIVRLRLWYGDIVKKNNELPEHCRLADVEMTITSDSHIRREQEAEAALKQLNLEMAWATEKEDIALRKVKSFYKDTLEWELFCLKAFNSGMKVRSFRVPKKPAFFYEAKEMVENHVTPREVHSETTEDDLSETSSSEAQSDPKPKRKPGMDKFVYQRMVRLWERKQRKVRRHHEWKEFLATEPRGKELREEDRAIEEATTNMGDMKLKMAKDYKVPEEKKLTEHRGRKRLLFLEEIIFDLKDEFNQRMLHLRQQKIKHLERMNKYKTLILEKQKFLSESQLMSIPTFESMTIDENPNSYMNYTGADIKAYKRKLEEKAKAQWAFVASLKPKKAEPAPGKRKPGAVGTGLYRKASSTIKIALKELLADVKEERDVGSYVETIQSTPTALEQHISMARVTDALFYQKYYIERIEHEKFIFDGKLKLLRHRKMKLDYLLKIADERMVLLTEEFMLAQRSEAMEASMEKRIMAANKERRDCGQHIKTLSKRFEAVKKEVDAYARQRAALLNEVLQIATRAQGFEKYLTRVFNKKISRARSKSVYETVTETTEDSDEESDDSSDMDMEFDDEDDDGLDIDFPPPELNKDIYDQVIEVRGRRLDVDDLESSSREVHDELNTNINQLKARVRDADKEFDRCRRELDTFRQEKQQILNNLDCAVSLKCHQFYVSEKELTDALVTENSTINRLRNRIPELKKEKRFQRKKGLDIKKTHQQLVKEKQKFIERLEEMEKKIDAEMLKKFGAVHPLEELENFAIDPEILALRKESDKLQHLSIMETCEMQVENSRLQRQRMTEVRKETERMMCKAEMTREVNAMTADMANQMKKLPGEFEDETTRKEIAFLKQLVTKQWRTINSLNLEITRMTQRRRKPLPPIHSHHKDGHGYADN